MSDLTSIKIIECPRDAMQGITTFIPTKTKIEYLNALLKVGFHALDCGSFVSPKAIPQMKDTFEVIPELDLSNTETKLSVVVANVRGAEQAANYDEISFIGYPFSVSETFQKRNTNATIEQSLERVEQIINICECHAKELVIYISMAFGNPYGDVYDPVIVEHWVDRLQELGVNSISISDTIGVATPPIITDLYNVLYEDFPNIEFGSHFHTTPNTWLEKIEAAYENGCKRFDGAIKGFGGCPMAKDDLTGNMPTENLIQFFEEKGIPHGLNKAAFEEAYQLSAKVFL
jgi:hydroxymethylglutaryl-CoA lyase